MKKQQGFTLIELVIVVIILGLLAATALPRFLTVTDQAEEASVEGVAGGFAAAVGLVRAQFELAGRKAGSANQTTVSYDGVLIGVDPTSGYPTADGTDSNTLASTVTQANCLQIFSNILQAPPSATTSTTSTTVAANKFLVRVQENQTGSNDLCVYYLVRSLGLENNPSASIPADGAPSSGRGFTYLASSGQVFVFDL